MRKFICLIVTTVLLCFSLTSCKLDFGGFDVDGGDKTVVFYAVGVHIDELSHTCLYSPAVGHVTMPGLKSGDKKPEYSVGDLVKITFVEKNGDIPIMESFPEQFGAKATEIVVKNAEVGYHLTEEGVFFSNILSADMNLSVGEEIAFTVSAEGKEKEIAKGTVTVISDGRYTVLLENYGTGDEFFKFIFEKELRINKK